MATCAQRIRRAFLSAAVASIVAGPVFAAGDFYQQRNLVSDGTVPAENRDANLVNGWGVAFNPFGFVWVADNGTGVATLYDGNGKPQSLVVTIPAANNATEKAKPTGIVFSGGMGFAVSQNGASGPSRFLFATEDGAISGWAPTVDMTHAIRMVDRSSAGAVYKGLALSAGGDGNLLYAADFHNNRIDVFDSDFQQVTLSGNAFSDPNLPAGFAPFGIQVINGNIYVTYAKQDAQAMDEVRGKGLGIVNEFDPNGRLLRRFKTGGALNAPWGLALAPSGFGKFGNRLLIGNFGDGLINAYDLATGEFVGKLRSTDRKVIRIDGLWGLAFGNGFQKQPVTTLFFAAGPNDEEHGLYGRIDAVDNGQTDNAAEAEGADD